jgi:putative transposase
MIAVMESIDLRTEQIQLTQSHPNWAILDDLSFRSKNLHNYTNYLLREKFFKKEKQPSKFDLVKQFAKEDQVDYRSLPAQTSQQIIYDLFLNWKSFFALLKFKKQQNCKPPKYKHKKKGRNIVILTNQQCKIVDDELVFPKSLNLKPIKTRLNAETEKLKEVRILPKQSHYVVEIVYEKAIQKTENLNPELFLGIDLGINNIIAATLNNSDKSSFVIKGGKLKSMNQFYNKSLARLKSLCEVLNKLKTTKRIQKLHRKRNNKVKDFTHKVTRKVIDFCKSNHVGNIVIGYNENWKNGVNLGKATNQKFVQIPFLTLVRQLQYKAKEAGITVILTEESYTSQTDNYNFDPFGASKKRIHRGLFKSSNVGLVNADINGAFGILRKVVGAGLLALPGRGCVLHPLKFQVS